MFRRSPKPNGEDSAVKGESADLSGPRPRDERSAKELDLGKLFKDLIGALGEFGLVPERTRRLGYQDAIAWFIENRPPGTVAKRGAILRTKLATGRMEVVQLFLDERWTIVCDKKNVAIARCFLAEGLDDELDRAFGGADLLIVE